MLDRAASTDATRGSRQRQVPTFEEFAEEFLAYQATLNKPAELARKKSVFKHHLFPAFGKHRLDQIDERMIDAYKVEKSEQPSPRGSTLDSKTINNTLKVLGRMFRDARKWKLIKEVPDIGLLKVRKSEFDFLDFAEGDAFIEGAAKHLPEWHPFVVVAMRGTGSRRPRTTRSASSAHLGRDRSAAITARARRCSTWATHENRRGPNLDPTWR